jgi:hypothetical protein
VNCGCCGAAGCGVFSDMKVLVSYVVMSCLNVCPPVEWHISHSIPYTRKVLDEVGTSLSIY